MDDLSKRLQTRVRQIRRRPGYWFAVLLLRYQVTMHRLCKHTEGESGE